MGSGTEYELFGGATSALNYVKHFSRPKSRLFEHHLSPEEIQTGEGLVEISHLEVSTQSLIFSNLNTH